MVLGWIVLLPAGAASQTLEFFVQADFAAEAGSRNIIGFDIPAQANNALQGEEYLGCGVTVSQVDGGAIKIIGNSVTGGFGGQYPARCDIMAADCQLTVHERVE